jgi:hypothetical protein
MKHMLETLINLYGADIFAEDMQLKMVMDELFSSDSYKKSRNLLGIALGQLGAYSRLKSLGGKEFMAVEALTKEMHEDFDIIAESAKAVMEAIGEVAASTVLRIDGPKMPIIGLASQVENSETAVAPPDNPDAMLFGKYRWRILKSEKKHLLFIAEDVIICRDWGKEHKWHYSEIRGYLNGAFFNSFSPDEQRQILPMGLIGNVFLLTSGEANAYFHSDSDRIAKHAGKDVDWWLRPERDNHLDYITAAGRLAEGSYSDICNEIKGIRPALWVIDSKKLRKRR